MKISNIITGERPSLSFEVFPPKSDDKLQSVQQATDAIAALSPSYMSVTYGAGGGTSAYTGNIAAHIQNDYGVPALAHLSCISSTHAQITDMLRQLRDLGVDNILALRGDMPKGMDTPGEYAYAAQLIETIRDFGGFCIGAACYPEGHPQSESSFADIGYLKHKVECGCSFLTTQMFFDNNILYNFLYRIREAGIRVPVVAGIMPVTNPKQIRRICDISGTALPQRFLRIVERYGDRPAAMRQAGIAYAMEQIIDLYANGVNAVHVYSMNNADVARTIQSGLSEILK
jgi:methylenetetrahydrofolate reductase (NADPH)